MRFESDSRQGEPFCIFWLENLGKQILFEAIFVSIETGMNKIFIFFVHLIQLFYNLFGLAAAVAATCLLIGVDAQIVDTKHFVNRVLIYHVELYINPVFVILRIDLIIELAFIGIFLEFHFFPFKSLEYFTEFCRWYFTSALCISIIGAE